jgi:hypothetical protein
MSYAELYHFCQTQSVPVSRSTILPKVTELTKRPRPPRIMLRTLDPAIIAGFIVWPGQTEHPWVKWGKGEPLIVIARAHNYCWRRFVVVKELMHCFDQSLERVTTPDEFEALVSEFNSPQLERSNAMKSEVKALWMALGVLCPEELRQDLERKRAVGEVTDMDIAMRLRIPVAYVPNLFHPQFKNIMAWLTSC